MVRRITLACSVGALALLSTGCGSSDSSGAPDGNGRLVMSMFSESGDLVDINPVGNHIPMPAALVYDTLVRRTESGALEPRLATKWTATDPKTWRLTLRKGVMFHDKSAFDAKDVAATLRFVLDPDSASGYLRFIRTVEKVVVVDPFTVDLVSSMPNRLIPLYLNQVPMLSDEQLGQAKDDHATRLLGTGPYSLAQWKQGESVLAKRNPAYWGDKPRYAQVLLKSVPEPSTRLADLQSGESQVIADVLPEQSKLLTGEGTKVVTEPAVSTTYLAFVQQGAFKSAAVRRAFYHAIDRKAIVEAAFGEYAEPATSVVPAGFQGYADLFPVSDHDPAKARQMLDSAGVKTPVVGQIDSPPRTSSVAELVRQQAQEAGFDIKVNIVPPAQLFDAKRIAAGSGPRLLMPTSLDNRMFDAYRPLETLFGESAFIAEYGYKPEPENQRRIEAYLAATEPAVRNRLSTEMQRTAISNPPVMPLYFPTNVYAIAKGTCYDASGTGQLRVDRLRPCP